MLTLIDGTCFICNDCGDKENDNNEKCSGPSQSNAAPSTCIETTAYTLQALIDNEDTDNVVCLSSWLANQKNIFGVFSSSQVMMILCILCSCVNSHKKTALHFSAFIECIMCAH